MGFFCLATLHARTAAACALIGFKGGAIRAYQDALALTPESATTHFDLGEALGRQGRWWEAVQAFREAVRLNPWNAEYQANLVLALGRASRWDLVAGAARRLADLRPRDPELHLLLGLVFCRVRRAAEAIRAFRWAAEIPERSSAARCFLGETLFGPKPWLEAVQLLETVRRSRRPAVQAPPVRTVNPAIVSGARRAIAAKRTPGQRIRVVTGRCQSTFGLAARRLQPHIAIRFFRGAHRLGVITP